MKEKIKLIVLIVIFGVVMLGAAYASKKLERTLDKVEVIAGFVEENNQTNTTANVTTSVISSFNSNTTPILYSDVVEEEKIGEVIEVTEETFDDEVLNSRKRILIEFYADWCGPCKTLSPILEEIAKENLDIKVVKINVDENPNLALDYGANYIPLLVVVEDGKTTNHAVGALPKKEILELVK